jgi:Zn-finger nucleic acid-binding protein
MSGDNKPDTLTCGNCRAAMRRLRYDGHYGASVEIDLCQPCHLVWFDGVESARITKPSLLELIGEMARSQRLAHEPLSPKLACARCNGPTKTVHNRSRWGATLQLECLRRHGAYQSFAQFLAEKGLVRPLSAGDRAALLRRDGRLGCLNCGAELAPGHSTCAHCGATPGMFDVARLASALDPEGATAGHAVHATATQHVQRGCAACGAPMPPEQSVQCDQCGATLAISRLDEAHAKVSALADALRSHQQHPAPHVVAQRLSQQHGSIERQRDWAREVQREADARSDSLHGFGDNPLGLSSTQAAVLVAVCLVLMWWLA